MSDKLPSKAAALRSAAWKQPSKEEIVKALSNPIETVIRENNKGEKHCYIVRRCPKGDNCRDRSGGRIEFREKTGFTNPFAHLKKCCFHGDDEAMMRSYWEAIAAKKQQSHLKDYYSKKEDIKECSIVKLTVSEKELWNCLIG